MCTATWLSTDHGYELLFNRDELRSRSPAGAPRARSRDGVRYLAPEDGDAGGTWILVNELGASVCLLNLYQEGLSHAPARPDGTPFTSRGLLVTDLGTVAGPEECRSALERRDLAAYRPFTLFCLAPAGENAGGASKAGASGLRAALLQWDGRRLADLGDRPEQPLISSGYDLGGAARSRREAYASYLGAAAEQDLPRPDDLDRFHRSHHPERGPYSVCMHRHDARTVSLTRVSVRRDWVSMAYAPGPPCSTPLGAPERLDRAAAAVTSTAS